MKILGIISGERITGSMFHRIIYPLSALMEYHDVKVDTAQSLLLKTDEELCDYDIVLVHSTTPNDEEIKRLLRLGVNVVMDFDDYWKLSTKHELYDAWKEKGEMERLLKFFDLNVNFTTTSETLKKKIQTLAYKKDVCVLPNGMIDDEEYRKPLPKDKINFGWMGATNHITDLMMIQHLRIGYGFDICVPENYRTVFRNRFNYFNGLNVPDYLNLYNTFDIIVVPLDRNEFNTYKSELKLIEAGFYKKPVIVSDVEPYSSLLKDGENCLVVKKHRHWAKHCKTLLEDKDLREKLGNQLHEDMKEKFDLKKITKNRYDYFKKITEDV